MLKIMLIDIEHYTYSYSTSSERSHALVGGCVFAVGARDARESVRVRARCGELTQSSKCVTKGKCAQREAGAAADSGHRWRYSVTENMQHRAVGHMHSRFDFFAAWRAAAAGAASAGRVAM